MALIEELAVKFRIMIQVNHTKEKLIIGIEVYRRLINQHLSLHMMIMK